MKNEVVIIGGGPGGSATAMFLAGLGIRSTIIEKESFPRYHIGESLTTECGNLLRDLGLEKTMLEGKYPIKRGVKVYGPGGKNSFYVPIMIRTPEGLQDAHSWQMRRSDADKMLLDEAIARGADMVWGQAVAPLRDKDGYVSGVRVRMSDGETKDFESRVLVDASGQSTFLCKSGVTSRKDRGTYCNQSAVFSQVKNTIREEGDERDDTMIFYRDKNHWAWFIPLDDEIVSVGVGVPSDYFASKKESPEEFLVRELEDLNSELARRVPDRTLVEETRTISNYSYRIHEFTAKAYLCVGDSHRFIDPIFSFGVTFALAEGRMAAKAIADYLGGATGDEANPFAEYQDMCERGQEAIQSLIDAFWDHPYAFALFAHQRYREDFIDMFAARIYGDEPYPGLVAIQKLNAKTAGGSAQPAE